MPELNLNVGDDVAYARWRDGRAVGGGISKVVKINRWGHITLENGKVFTKNGCERTDGYYGSSLLSVEQYREWQARDAAQKVRNNAAHAIATMLTGYRNGYGNVCAISDEEKAKLKELVDRL